MRTEARGLNPLPRAHPRRRATRAEGGTRGEEGLKPPSPHLGEDEGDYHLPYAGSYVGRCIHGPNR